MRHCNEKDNFQGREPWSSGFVKTLVIHEFESQHSLLDGHFLHLFVVTIVIFLKRRN